MAAGLKLIRQLLDELHPATRQLLNAGVGAGLGAGAAELTGGDPLTGAAMGGFIGLASTGTRVPEQWRPTDPIIGRQMDRWTAAIDEAPSMLSARQRFLTRFYDVLTPWKDRIKALVRRGILSDDEATQIASTVLGGGFGTVQAELDPLTRSLQGLRDEGLLDALRTRLGFDMERRAWAVKQEHLRNLELDYYDAIGRGDRARIRDLEPQVNALRQQLADRKVSYGGSTPAEIAERIKQFEAELGPERLQRVQSVADEIYATSRRATEALGRDLLTPEALRVYLDRVERGFPYIPGWRSIGAELDPATGLLVQARRSLAERARARQGASVKNLDNLIDKLEGSDVLPYDDPLKNVLHFVAESHKEAQRNRAAKALIEAVSKDPDLAASGLFRKLRPGETLEPGMGKVAYFEKGRVQEFAVPVEFADTLNFAHANDIVRGLRVLSRMQRYSNRMLTTANIGFLLRNVPRDISDALLLTSEGAIPSLDEIIQFGRFWKQALVEELRGEMTAGRERFKRSGAAFSTLTSSLRETPTWQAAVEPPSGLRGLFERLQDYQGAFEDATKRATFETLLARGMPELEAAYTTRRFGGSPDFFQKGTLGTEAGIFFQFFNPQVQGIGRLVEKIKSDPLRALTQVGALTAGFSALHAYNSQFIDPDTGRPAIESVPVEIRMQNIVIMKPGPPKVDENGNTVQDYFRIPLGHVARALLAPIVGIMQHVTEDPFAESPAQIASNTLSNFLPISGPIDLEEPARSAVSQLGSGLNPLLRVPLEQAANRSFFNQVPIVGKRVERLQPEYQFTEDTWPVAIFLAQKVFPWLPYLNSPDRMEHILRSMLPGPGEQVLGPLNASMQDYLEDPSKIPVLGPIARSFVTSPQDAFRQEFADDFYDRMNQAQAAVATRNRLINEGRLQELQAFEQDPENIALVLANPRFTQMAKALSLIARERERIKREVPVGPERDAALSALWRRQMQILQAGAQPLMVQ